MRWRVGRRIAAGERFHRRLVDAVGRGLRAVARDVGARVHLLVVLDDASRGLRHRVVARVRLWCHRETSPSPPSCKAGAALDKIRILILRGGFVRGRSMTPAPAASYEGAA